MANESYMSARKVAAMMVRDGKAPTERQVSDWVRKGVAVRMPNGKRARVKLGYVMLPSGMSFTLADVEAFLSKMTALSHGIGVAAVGSDPRQNARLRYRGVDGGNAAYPPLVRAGACA